MKLLLLDENGNELQLARVSLIDGGVEIVVGGIHELQKESNASSDGSNKSATIEHESTIVKTDTAEHVSLFNNSSEQTSESLPSAANAGNADTVLGAADGASVAVDSTGRTWDERIDSSNHKTVASNGKWARRRNVEDAVYAGIIQELLATPADETISDLPLPDEGDLHLPDGDGLPAPDDDLPLPADDTPLPDGNTIGDDDDGLDDILGEWDTK